MLSKRERRVGIIAGVVLGALALDQLLVTPLLARKQSADTRLALVQEDMDQALKVQENGRRAARRWADLAGNTLQNNAPAAESQVLNRVRDWAQSAGLSLTSLKPERSEEEQGFRKITIRATATGRMEQVSRFLFAVQTADVPIRVSDMQLASRRDGTDDLSLQIALSTIYLPPQTTDATEVTR